MTINKTIAIALNEVGDEFSAKCPKCEKEFEFQGYFDPDDKTECTCGCVFTIESIEFEDGSYIC